MLKSAFTLLELMVSLTLVGLIAAIIFGSLRIGSRAWERGERDVEAHQKVRIALDLIRRQLASTCVREIQGPGEQPLLLKGDDKSLAFVSHTPLVPGNAFGMVYAVYRVQPGEDHQSERLAFYEKNVVLLEKDQDLDDPEEEELFELISEVQSIGFAYLKDQTEGETGEWQQTWDPEEEKDFPRAVKVMLTEDAETAPITIIARIESGKET